MKAHTSSFKEQIKTMGRELDSKITYTLNGVNVELGGEQLNSITPTYQGALLKSVMKELDIDSNVYIPVGTILNYQFGVKVNGEYEYINYGNYIVYKAEKQEDTNSYKLTCYDKMLYSMKNYDDIIKNANITYPITIRNYINKLATLIGLSFKNASSEFDNYNKQIASDLYYGQEYTIRDVLDELAEVTASTICISQDDKLEIRYITETNDTIDEEFLKDVNVSFGEKYGPINSIVLSRSAESDNVYLQDETSIAENGLCELKIIDNQIMNWNDRSDYLQDIFTRLNGTYYYLNDFSSTGITYLDLCDRYNVKIGDNTYSCVMLNDEINITQGLEENIYTEMPEETQTDYTKADKTDRKINQTYLIVDKQNQEITSVVSKVDKQNEQIATISQQVGELNSKITNVANVTSDGETIYANLTLNNINQSEPIELKIHPTSENISYLYPRENLFPSDTLFPKTRTLRFKNTKTDETFDYELPDDLLYYDSDNYDEFYLNYDSEACYITKKCGYNADGSVYLLDSPVTNTYTYPKIYLTDGDYEISLLGYSNGYLYARLMAANLYTTQFATKVELNSTISQTAEQINAEVSKKVGQNEVISRINQTAETITIEANKVNIGGVINSINNNTTTTINGDKITTGSITANQVASDVITTKNFSAQKINADNITSGTINADKINGGTITASAINLGSGTFTANTSGTIKATSGSIGGFSLDGSSGLTSSYGTIRPNGNLLLYPNYGSARYVLSSAMTFNAQGGVVIASNSNANISAPSNNLDLKACSGGTAYMGCMATSAGTSERSSVRCKDGELSLHSAGTIYANGAAIGGSSSKNTKTNIEELSQEKKEELYGLIKDIPLYEYDYKPEYGKKVNYGFLIEDIEDTKLNDLLHIVEVNEDIKTYCSEDLTRLNLIMIKELMKKVETLENKIKELESDK